MNMMRQLILLFVTIVLSSISWGQVVLVQFIDAKSGENVHNVNVLAKIIVPNNQGKDSLIYLISSSKGIISFKLQNVSIGTQINVNCTHPIYESYSKTVKTKSVTDTLKFTFLLQPTKLLQLKEVVIKAPGIPDTVFQSERLSVGMTKAAVLPVPVCATAITSSPSKICFIALNWISVGRLNPIISNCLTIDWERL